MSTRARRRNVFRRDGEYWTVVYRGLTCHFRDTRGLQLLAVLLRRPGDWVPAGELLACVIEDRGGAAAGVLRERVRVHATQAVKAALRKITPQMPALGEHLALTVRTGNRCAYLPDPRVPIAWDTGSPSVFLLSRIPKPRQRTRPRERADEARALELNSEALPDESAAPTGRRGG